MEQVLFFSALCALPCLLVVFVALFGGIVYFSRKQCAHAWRELAARTGLTFEPGRYGSPRVVGAYRGRALRLDTFTRGTDEPISATRMTRIVLAVNNRANVFFSLGQEGVLSKIGQAVGVRDVQIGDAEIDRRFVVRSQPESFAARVFAARGLRQRLLQVPPFYVEVNGRELRFEQAERDAKPDDWLFLCDLLSDLAEVVEQVVEELQLLTTHLPWRERKCQGRHKDSKERFKIFALYAKTLCLCGELLNNL